MCWQKNYGHYYYNAYYDFTTSQNEIDRLEYKALKWKSIACISPQSILDCFCRGLCNIWEIAEELQVEPNMVEFAYNYYVENKLLYSNIN